MSRWLFLAPSVTRRVSERGTPRQGRAAGAASEVDLPFALVPARPGPRRPEPTPKTKTLGFDAEPT